MGFMLLYSRKRSLTNDIMSENPNKKIKLECQNKNNRNAGNDDLWGQDDDITAEEFDLLEIQATQSCNQTCSLRNNTLQASNLLLKSNSSVEVHNLKQLQYELEGRVKLLSLSLEKSTKELSEERLNREQLINERMRQFHEHEVNLKKEIGKMQSILEFKDQEMKSTYSKLQMLKSQLQDKKGVSAEMAVNSEFDDFLKSSKSKQLSVRHNNIFPVKHHRKYKLSVDMPKGEVNGIEIMSSILCTRLSIPSFVNKESMINYGGLPDFSFSSCITPVSILYLKNEQKCDEILDCYCKFLKNHVTMLKALTVKNNQATFNSFPVSTKAKEAFSSQTVISYLSDIRYIYSNPRFKSLHQKCNINHESLSKNMHIQKSEIESFSYVQEDEKQTVLDSTLSLLQSLSSLSNPEAYPNGYHKNEEIESSLSALLSICLSCPKHFLDLIEELPCYLFSNPYQSVTGLCTVLKLLIAICTKKSFISYLVHKESNCTFCLISTFLHIAVPVDPEKFAIAFTLVEDLLSSVFSIHNYKETELEASICVSKVIQGMIKSLWKYFQIRKEKSIIFEILKKGFLLLYFISSYIPNFKEKRNPVEEDYISLISGMLAISKENCELKEFYDLIHNLWDFQTDMSEFDLDELSEEAHACTNDIE